MSNPLQLLPRTAIAATSWPEGALTILRVFTQATDGNIRHSDYRNGWSGGDQKTNIGKARLNTPAAVISWNDGQEQNRVYYLNNDNVIQELCWGSNGNKGWYAGALNKSNIAALPASQLTAVRERDEPIRVFYQGLDAAIHEVVHSQDAWRAGRTLGPAIVGSGLASVTWGNSYRVYAQTHDSNLVEYAADGTNYYTGGFPRNRAPATAALAAITWSTAPQIRVYTISQTGELQEYAYQNGWSGPKTLPGPSVPASNVSALRWGEISGIRLYRQAENNKVLEEVWDSGSNWATGSIIPTGPVQ